MILLQILVYVIKNLFFFCIFPPEKAGKFKE